MASEPHRYDHDEVHGSSLMEQQRLAAALVDGPAEPDGLSVAQLFEQQRLTAKANALRDVGNQKPLERRPSKRIVHKPWLKKRGPRRARGCTLRCKNRSKSTHSESRPE